MPLNAHRVFVGRPEDDSYLAELNLSQDTERRLRAARDEIREALRVGLRDWSKLVSKSELFEEFLAGAEPPRLMPKFRMQGSFVYHTCNQPEQVPPQEVDLDDGLFLPVSFLSRNGRVHPAVASKGLFLAVERILEPLCQRRGWQLNKSKPSCVRIEIDGHAHVDIALYAIPDEEFLTLTETQAAARAGDTGSRIALMHQLRDSLEFTEDLYEGLRHEQIMLAHREDGWKPSDPRKLEDWYRDAIRTYGEQVRRVSRYLKGWRDFQWPVCRLASVALMSAVVTAYQKAKRQIADNRDDEALLLVAEHLPGLLSGRIPNPVVEGQYLDERWTAEQRGEFVARARDLLARVQHALRGTDDPEEALAAFAAAFGTRIPDDPDLIAIEGLEQKSTLSAPSILIPSGVEAARRAELAARELEARGTQSKPWYDGRC